MAGKRTRSPQVRQAIIPRLIGSRAARRSPYRQRSRLLEVRLDHGPYLGSALAPSVLRTKLFEILYRQVANQFPDLGQGRERYAEFSVPEPEKNSHSHRIG